MPMNTVCEILDIIGRKYVAQQLDVRKTAVSNAATAGRFPAAWYPTIKRCAAEKDIEVPDHLFSWREKSEWSEKR